MLRRFLIFLSHSSRLRRIVTGWSIPRRLAARFVAGDTLEAAVPVIKALNARGLLATLDHLGEHVEDVAEAERALADYLALIDAIEAGQLKAGISLKLTQLGLEIDPVACVDKLESVVRHAAERGVFVRIDMEHSAVVDATLETYRQLRQRGYHTLGLVIQSYLYRSHDDTAAMLALGAPIRLVKGAYDEPPERAYPNKAEVDAAFDQIARRMIEAALDQAQPAVSTDGRRPAFVALGTHDEARIEAAIQYAHSLDLPKPALEIQLLHGIRAGLGDRLAGEGYPVRIYVPYGTEWYAYFMRRLAERPANLWFLLSNLFRR
jgi:proline dehydrogenase